MSKHRKMQSHCTYERLSTVVMSGAPEVSYISTRTGWESYMRMLVYVS